MRRHDRTGHVAHQAHSYRDRLVSARDHDRHGVAVLVWGDEQSDIVVSGR